MTKKKFHGSRKRKAELAQEQPEQRASTNVNAGRKAVELGCSPPGVAQSRSLALGVLGALGVIILGMCTFDFTLHLPPPWPGASPPFAARGIEQVTDPTDEPEDQKERETKQRY